ncbi:protein SAD1/UNC-84 domain protein 1-like [Phalaenopsis equestris]|uniref:protein SAD1/UNC-84 domain protein 1-like n=1 Tax=Phalaenopsis equestris TaxID=78828 RepID=UPI0009E36ECC|nr:protein SAD1/UNC-84 domain protein 1-like [Phalaenopsis equestris]
MNSSPTSNKNAALSMDSNPNAKRRAVVVVERTSKTSVLPDGGVHGANNDGAVYNGKDLSHTLWGETALDRPRNLSRLKKGVLAASVPSKHRRSAHRQAKPLWQTILSTLTKNLLLLAALLYIGQVIWRWTAGAKYPLSAFDFDNRISEVESSLKKTAKMLQVQLDVVDKKIGSEIGIVTRELAKQIEEKGALFEKELNNLEAKTDDLVNSISELKDAGFLSKEEFEKFLTELKTGSLVDANKDAYLDHIRQLAKVVVEKEIEKHAADGLGRVDYALASGGAKVVKHSEPYVIVKANSWLAVAKPKGGIHSSAQKMLEPSFGEPGQCFPLQGNSGFVEIRLRTGIVPDAVTLEHVSESVAYDRSSAPKDCRVSGWFEGPENDASAAAEKILILTEFSYDLNKSNAQTFPISTVDSSIINMVRLDFTSNHGSSSHTCIYRLRVHGFEPSSPLATTTEQP